MPTREGRIDVEPGATEVDITAMRLSAARKSPPGPLRRRSTLPQSAEAWATLGFVLDRTGDHVDAVAASRRAVTLEPDNWRHHFRLAFVTWGEERLRAARRTLALFPGFPLAHWLASPQAAPRGSGA